MTTEGIISISIGIGGFLFGVFAYFTSGVLADKKQTTINTTDIVNIKERLRRLENDNDKN